ncbi:MAG: site-specific integrase [Candidatus Amulumruptor sp.]
MASIKLKFRPSLISDKEGTLYYQIIHERKIRQLTSGYTIASDQWDSRRSTIIYSRHSDRYPDLLTLRERIRSDMERIARIVRNLDGKRLTYSADDVIDEFNRYSRDGSLRVIMCRMIDELKQRGQVRTAETYRAALNSFSRFLSRNGSDDMMLDAITSQTMLAYEAYLKARGNMPNTTSFYMRILRAVYNHAVESEIIEDRHPFRKVFTGADKTVKRALPLAQLKKIRNLDLSQSPRDDLALDMFMMSFYLRGMSFIDMAFLRKSDLSDGYVTYRRRKTGQQLRIRWTAEMQEILDRHRPNPTRYLLPIIMHEDINQRNAYRNASERINRSLRKIAPLAGIQIPLTLYCARHSWASAAQTKGIPLSVISEGMGHDSEATTRIYLASIDTASAVDRANALILRSL